MPRFTTSDGVSLFYQDEGGGSPVLCLAGLTRNSMDFGFVLPHLAGYRVIRLDYRGRGQSDYTEDYLSYSIPREARDVIELLDHLGIDRTAIIGTSRGGLISMAIAAAGLGRMSGVVLNDIGPVVHASGLTRIMDYVGKEPPYSDYDDAAEAMAVALADDFPGVSRDRWRMNAAHMWLEKPEGGLGLRYDKHLRNAILEQSSAGLAPDMWAFFEAMVSLPVGVIRGANSDLLSQDTVQLMHDRHPGLVSASVPNRGHVPFLDEPEALTVIQQVLEESA